MAESMLASLLETMASFCSLAQMDLARSVRIDGAEGSHGDQRWRHRRIEIE
jgi:hypothetical protein